MASAAEKDVRPAIQHAHVVEDASQVQARVAGFGDRKQQSTSPRRKLARVLACAARGAIVRDTTTD